MRADALPPGKYLPFISRRQPGLSVVRERFAAIDSRLNTTTTPVRFTAMLTALVRCVRGQS